MKSKQIMKAKPTQRDWIYHAQGDANNYCIMTTEKKWVISFIQNGELWAEEQEENARLMAASPKLLKALNDLQNWVVQNTSAYPAELINALQIIEELQ